MNEKIQNRSNIIKDNTDKILGISYMLCFVINIIYKSF